jgi:hypothetical protein
MDHTITWAVHQIEFEGRTFSISPSFSENLALGVVALKLEGAIHGGFYLCWSLKFHGKKDVVCTLKNSWVYAFCK